MSIQKPSEKIPPPKFGLATEIFGRLWAFWGLIVFLPTMFIAMVPIVISYLIPEPYGVKTFKATSQIWMGLFLFLVGCRLRIRGKKHFDTGKNYVVVCNHRSLMDVPLMTPFFPGANKTIAKKSMSRIPVFGWIYSRGAVLVDRSNEISRKRSFDGMRKVLMRDNLNMVLYPEGTRNRTGKPLKTFYDGAFKLAIDCKKDIIPVVIFNTDKALPPGKPFFLLPKKLEMHLLPPISTDQKKAGELKEEVFDIMWKYYEERQTV